MNENNNEQEQPLYKEQPWWVYIGKIDIDSVSMAVALTVGIYPLIKMLEKL